MFRFVLVICALWHPATAQMSLREALVKGGEPEVMDAALRNPSLALQQISLLLPQSYGPIVLERLAVVAPDEVMNISRRSPELSRALAAGSPQMNELAFLGANKVHNPVERGRVAFFAGAISRRVILRDAAWRLAAATPRYFAELADRRVGASADEAAGFDRGLEAESLTLCRAAQESGGRTLMFDFAGFRGTDVYLALAFGGADCDAVFVQAFDKLLVPALNPNRLPVWLERTQNWKLRGFTASALAAGRLERFVGVAGARAISKLALGLDRLADAVAVAEMAGATNNVELRRLLVDHVSSEWERVHRAPDRRGEVLYGLLAARLLRASAEASGLRAAGEPYSELLESSARLDTAVLFDSQNRCLERYFFWDDNDGVESFANFRSHYEHDPAWEIEAHDAFIHLTARGEGGRVVEIFANIPIDIRQPENAAREGEAQRRQAAIAAELTRRGLTPAVLAHRGHAFHVEKTLAYMTPAAQLVVLGSCRGASDVHRVIEVSHKAQVIATRGIGATEINDSILKALNMRLLSAGNEIRWADFWREEQAREGRSSTLQQYITPDRDEAAAFLRAYYQALDRLGVKSGAVK